MKSSVPVTPYPKLQICSPTLPPYIISVAKGQRSLPTVRRKVIIGHRGSSVKGRRDERCGILWDHYNTGRTQKGRLYEALGEQTETPVQHIHRHANMDGYDTRLLMLG